MSRNLERILRAALVMAVVVSAACSGSSGGGGDDDVSGLPDAWAPDVPTRPDTGVADVPTKPDGASDASIYADIPLEEGRIGWPCTENSECASGYCIPSATGSVCSQTCISECPEGWLCRRAPQSVDLQYVCVPLFVTLCDPCDSNADCTGGYEGIDDRCLDFGDGGKFCGGDCSATGRCPEGFACETVEGAVRQCRPVDDVCTCSLRAIRLELATECGVTNEAGRCSGTRTCRPAGLTDCDAGTPAVEVCDRVDNDCDGQVDDFEAGAFPCEKANQYGSCTGVGECINGITLCEGPEPEPEVCDGIDNDCDDDVDEGYLDSDADTYSDCIDADDDNDGIPDDGDICPADADPNQENFDGDARGDACDDDDDNDGVNDTDDCGPFDATMNPTLSEVCDRKDNDCNGQADDGICDDGNPCTTDLCDPVLGCSHEPNTAPCDDGNACTMNDTCIDAQCQPGQQRNCDDLNPCTDDLCNPSNGCYWVNNQAICEDGNFCTAPDTCANGTCRSGPVRTCNDDNPCTVDSCQADTGCVYDGQAMAGHPCDDEDNCFLGDTCAGGVCNSGPISYCGQQNSCPNGLWIGTCFGLGDLPVCIGVCGTP